MSPQSWHHAVYLSVDGAYHRLRPALLEARPDLEPLPPSGDAYRVWLRPYPLSDECLELDGERLCDYLPGHEHHEPRP